MGITNSSPCWTIRGSPISLQSLHDPILRLVQLYLDYNLIGQTNSSAKTSMTELYLLWCSKNRRKLHLGFWTAYLTHLVATHPIRNLSICNIVGMFVRNSVEIQGSENTSPIIMVDMPGLFDISFFVKTGIVYMREGVPRFYEVDETAFPRGRANMNAGLPAQTECMIQDIEQALAILVDDSQRKNEQIGMVNANIERQLEWWRGS